MACDKETDISLKSVLSSPKASNMTVRIIFGIAMLSLYLYLCSKNSFFLVLISLGLNVGITYEIITITRKNDKPFAMPTLLIFIISAIIFCQKAIPALVFFYPNTQIFAKLSILKPLLFSVYTLSLMYCVILLRRKNLKAQLLLLTIVHIGSYMGGLNCAVNLSNIRFGNFFFVYPSLLVIANDIFAYFVGKACGRTPLISLSPKKTVEGFIGGFIFTFIFGLLISFLKVKGLFLPDNNHSYLALPLDSTRPLLNLPIMYFHNFFFVIAASFFAPFSGFIASAIKRSFQKKDFGTLIPGHGGLTDRFDCQILMAYFVYYYLVFTTQNSSKAGSIYKFLVDNLEQDDLTELSKILAE